MATHDERLRVPLLWWPVGLGLAAFLAAEFHGTGSGVFAWLPYAVLLPAVAIALLLMGRVRVRIIDDEWWVDDARLPLRYVAAAEPLSGDAKRIALGPALQPLAFVVHRPWVGGAVRVVLDDPEDPTPYWIVSTRHPEQLAAALAPVLRQQEAPAPSGRAREER
jgi:hypothetical protein